MGYKESKLRKCNRVPNIKVSKPLHDLCAICTLGAAVPGYAWGGSFSVCGEMVFVQDAESSLTGRS